MSGDVERGRVLHRGGDYANVAVPLGEEAADWIASYLKTRNSRSDTLFVTARGAGMTRQAFWHLIRRYGARAIPGKKLSPHVLRHTAATHMARRGVPLWIIAKCLGNSVEMIEKTYGHWIPAPSAVSNSTSGFRCRLLQWRQPRVELADFAAVAALGHRLARECAHHAERHRLWRADLHRQSGHEGGAGRHGSGRRLGPARAGRSRRR